MKRDNSRWLNTAVPVNMDPAIKGVGRTVVFLMCLAVTVYGGVQETTALRSWTSASGKSIEAGYIGLDKGVVKLRSPDGNVFAIGAESLSDEDRQWIEQEEAKRNAPVAIQSPAKPNQLPVFKGGEWNNHHAGYTAGNYDAWIDGGGKVWIHPKVNGSRVGRAMQLSVDCYYRGDKQKYNAVPVISYNDPPDPVKQSASITLSGLLARDVPFNVTYAFTEDGIKVLGNCKDPPNIDHPTVFRMRVKMAASHNLNDFPSFDALKEVLKDWSVTLNPVSGKSRTYQYWESVRSMAGASRQVTIDTPVCDIIFKAGNLKVASLSGSIYSSKSPREGYDVLCSKDESDIKSGPLDFEIMIK